MYCTNLFRTYKGLDLYDFGGISRVILFSPFCSSSGRQCNDTRYCAVALLCCQSSITFMSSTWSHLSGTHLHHQSSIVRNITISLNKIERRIATCFVECYALIVLGRCYHIVLWSTEFATNCLVIIYHSLALGISRIQILKKNSMTLCFQDGTWLQLATSRCRWLQPHASTCSHFQ